MKLNNDYKLEEDDEEWAEWLASRPQKIKQMINSYPPDRLYKMGVTGHRVGIIAYSEDGTVRVWVGGKYNSVTFERQVFGVDINDLTECDLPGEDEILGVALTDREDIDRFLGNVREDYIKEKEGKS